MISLAGDEGADFPLHEMRAPPRPARGHTRTSTSLGEKFTTVKGRFSDVKGTITIDDSDR